MVVNGCDCTIVIKTSHCEKDIPYADETMREAVSFLEEEASIEGAGNCSGIRKRGDAVGCIVTPLTIGTAPLLLYLAMGSAGKPVFVSSTRGIFSYMLDMVPLEDTDSFGIRQQREETLLFPSCRVKGFELRFMRGEAIKLKLDIMSEYSPIPFPYDDTAVERETGERFNGDNVTYKINGKEYKNIYGLTLVCKKQGGTKTELWIKRALQQTDDIPETIEEMVITAQLLKDTYEYKRYGVLRIRIKRLIFLSDETEINTADGVIGPLRYYVAGTVSTEVFTTEEGSL